MILSRDGQHRKGGREKDGQGILFRDTALGLASASALKEPRQPEARIAKAVEITIESGADDNFLFCVRLAQTTERRLLKLLPDSKDVFMAPQHLNCIEERIIDLNGDYRILKHEADSIAEAAATLSVIATR